jgi:hypothetical protein
MSELEFDKAQRTNEPKSRIYKIVGSVKRKVFVGPG